MDAAARNGAIASAACPALRNLEANARSGATCGVAVFGDCDMAQARVSIGNQYENGVIFRIDLQATKVRGHFFAR
jgi:hypothetical protein